MTILGQLRKHSLWIAARGIIIVMVLSMVLALILPQREKVLDFVTLYAATLGVIHRVPIYNTGAITSLMITQLHLAPDFKVFPYPYPPWFALSTFFLAFLPPQQAANAWMLLNAAMLLACAFLLTDHLQPVLRILSALAVLIFIPSIGLMVVGQYSVPMLLGAALLLHAVKRENAPLTALALLLMTFKPHLGLFLLSAALIWLLLQKTPFARRAIWLTLAGGLLFAVLGFLADPAWPITYLHALSKYTTIQGVTDLGLSAGFSAMLVKIIFGYGSAIYATWLSVLLIVILLLLFWRFKVFNNVETLVSGCLLLTLLGDPYLLNYDYILLLLPLIYLFKQAHNHASRITLMAVYFLPWMSLLIERNANILFAFGAIVLVFMLLRQSASQRFATN